MNTMTARITIALIAVAVITTYFLRGEVLRMFDAQSATTAAPTHTVLTARTNTPEWLVGWETASQQAATSKRPILADFTGSDWCHWCILLKNEVFDTPEFAAWAAERVTLLEVDFPQKNPLPKAQAENNDKLAQRFTIEGFPTVLLLDHHGAVLGKLGYQAGGPKPWIAAAEALLKAAGH